MSKCTTCEEAAVVRLTSYGYEITDPNGHVYTSVAADYCLDCGADVRRRLIDLGHPVEVSCVVCGV